LDVLNLSTINANLSGASTATATPGNNAVGFTGGILYFDTDSTAGVTIGSITITGATSVSGTTAGVLTFA
jgi:hypothetical protein